MLRLATSTNDQTMMHPEMNASSSRMARAMVIGFALSMSHVLRLGEVSNGGTMWDIRSTSILWDSLNAHGAPPWVFGALGTHGSAVGVIARMRIHRSVDYRRS